MKKKYYFASQQIDEELRKIVPMVGAIGYFTYDVATDRSVWDAVERSIYGFRGGLNDGSFSKVLSMVDIKSKTKFQEMSVGFNGRELIVESAPILLENGNVVEEKYKFVRDKDFGLIKIIGQTKLLQVA